MRRCFVIFSFVIFSFVVMLCPDLAAASTRSPDVPLWKRLLSVLTPAPAAKSSHHDKARRSAAVAAPNSQVPLPVPAPAARQVHHDEAPPSTSGTPLNSPEPPPALAAWPVHDDQAPPSASEMEQNSPVPLPAPAPAARQLHYNEARPPTSDRALNSLGPPSASALAPWPVQSDQARPPASDTEPNSPEPPLGPPIHSLQKSTAANSDCNTGRRIVSAYYWAGQRTASGEPFNPNGLTAAHRTLPFGTRLNVTNPKTGQSVMVVVNDRGPFVSGVSLDLSLGAARAIGMKGVGAVCIW